MSNVGRHLYKESVLMSRRICTLLLSFCILFGLTACGDEGGTSEGNVSLPGRLNQDRIYYATELKLDVTMDRRDVDFGVYGPGIYYPEGQTIVTYSMADGQTTVDTYSWTDAPGQWTLEKICYGGSGEVYGLVKVGTTPYLCKFNTERKLVSAKSLAEHYQESGIGYSASESRLEVGSDDRVYLSNSAGLWIFEEDGNYKGEVSFGSVKDAQVLDFVGDAKRNLYVLYEDSRSQNQYVAEIDTEKAAVETIQRTIGLTGLGTADREGDILAFNQATAYLYDREQSVLYELFTWAECKVDGNTVYGIHSLADGSVFVAGNRAEGGIAGFLVKGMAISGQADLRNGKTDIVVGYIPGSSGLLVKAAMQFNNQSEIYHVVFEDYSWVSDEDGMARLEGLLAAGMGPDILDLSQCDVGSMLENGYLEDLSLYLEGSNVINEGDFLEFALEEYRMDGMLLAIPHHFSMSLMVGNSEFLGEEPGWTLEEVLTLLEDNRGNRVFAKEMRRTDIFEYLLYMNESLFVDRESGSCDFDNELFKRIVDVAEAYPVQYRTISDKEKDPIGLPELENGSGILCRVTGIDFQFLQPYAAALGGKINYIGYPDAEGSGVSAYTFDALGIASTSDCKEGAWEFLEHYIQHVPSDKKVNYFPTYRPAIEKLANRAMESGNVGTMWYGYEMWEFTHYLPDREEMDTFCELLERAQPEHFDTALREIILEELTDYYTGEITLDEAIANIEREVELELAAE